MRSQLGLIFGPEAVATIEQTYFSSNQPNITAKAKLVDLLTKENHCWSYKMSLFLQICQNTRN